MNVIGMFGDHPRHKYIAQKLAEGGDLCGLIIEQREAHIPEPPERLSEHLTDLYEHHFERRSKAESEFFGEKKFPDVPKLQVSQSELNSERVRDFIQDKNPEVTVTYGVHILSDETLAAIPGKAWNVHGGLSPEYRGVITHFWPSYMLEPQMTGVTLHELTPDVDAGPIVHQTGAELVYGDGVHELACRTVRKFGEELTTVLEITSEDKLEEPVSQTRSGKLWVSDDWRPEHLLVVYDEFDNRIVDHYLDGDFDQKDPDLIRQF